MPQEIYVVQLNSSTDCWMLTYNSSYERCTWTTDLNQAMTWETLAMAQAAATSINSGTVGTPK